MSGGFDDSLMANLDFNRGTWMPFLESYNDNTLIKELGITPVPEVTSDVSNKLLDPQGKEFATLQPSAIQFDDGYPSQDQFNTIDTYESQNSPESVSATPVDSISSINSSVQNSEGIQFQSEILGEPNIITEPPTGIFLVEPTVAFVNQPLTIQQNTPVSQNVAPSETHFLVLENNMIQSPQVLMQSQEVAPAPPVVAPALVPAPSVVASASMPAPPVALSPVSYGEMGKRVTRRKDVKRCASKPATVPSTSKKQDEPEKPKQQRRRRPKKPKKYEQKDRCDDPKEEKKRLNAINAKENREKKKRMMQNLQDQVDEITNERNELLKEVEELRQREQELRDELRVKYGIQI